MRWFSLDLAADGFSFESAIRAPSREKAVRKARRRVKAVAPKEFERYTIVVSDQPIASNWTRFKSRSNGFC